MNVSGVFRRFLRLLNYLINGTERKSKLLLTARFSSGLTVTGELTAMNLQDDQKVKLTLNPKDSAGNSASLDGAPQWSSSDTSIVTVTPSADGLSAEVVSGNLGTATITVTADADLGAGVKPLTASMDFTVIGGEATALGLTVGTPEPK